MPDARQALFPILHGHVLYYRAAVGGDRNQPKYLGFRASAQAPGC